MAAVQVLTLLDVAYLVLQVRAAPDIYTAVEPVVTDIKIILTMEFAKVVQVLFELFGALAEVFPVLMLHQLHRNFKYLRI
jgi:hypothetical protein